MIVCPFIHEEVGRKWVNGIAFVKPCVSVDEIQEDIASTEDQLSNALRLIGDMMEERNN